MSELPQTCVKCGYSAAPWRGPYYRTWTELEGDGSALLPLDRVEREALEYQCENCGYRIKRPCKDAAQ